MQPLFLEAAKCLWRNMSSSFGYMVLTATPL